MSLTYNRLVHTTTMDGRMAVGRVVDGMVDGTVVEVVVEVVDGMVDGMAVVRE